MLFVLVLPPAAATDNCKDEILLAILLDKTHPHSMSEITGLPLPSFAVVTSPTFCTTASERVYITTSSGKDANGGLQGAEGDRRAAICGANVVGAGGL